MPHIDQDEGERGKAGSELASWRAKLSEQHFLFAFHPSSPMVNKETHEAAARREVMLNECTPSDCRHEERQEEESL